MQLNKDQSTKYNNTTILYALYSLLQLQRGKLALFLDGVGGVGSLVIRPALAGSDLIV